MEFAIPLLASAFLIGGCLERGKPPASASSEERERSPPPSRNQKKAPALIDPLILSSRAFREAPLLAARVAAGDLPPVSDFIAYPKHILARYHPKYNPKATYADFRERTTEAQLIMNSAYPRISAWVPKEWVRGQRLVYERNPYYWKVDTEGNQLPYADRLIFSIIPDEQVILLKFMNGELDLYGRYSSFDNVPTLRSEEEKGKYVLRLSQPRGGPAFYLNWDAPNPALRKAFRNRKVRIPSLSDVSICELVAEHWRQVGVRVHLNPAIRDIIWPRRQNGTFDVHFWFSLEAAEDPLARPHDWAIVYPTVPFWHRNASKEGPDWLIEATRYLKDAMTTLDPGQLREDMARVRELHTENVPVIVLGSVSVVWGANRRLGNVPYENTAADVYRGWGRPLFRERIFIKE